MIYILAIGAIMINLLVIDLLSNLERIYQLNQMLKQKKDSR